MTPDELRDRITADCDDCKWEWEICSYHADLLSVVREAIAAELDAAAGGSGERTRARAARWRQP